MKYAEINRRFTETLAGWLAKGYVINTGTMRDSVDLTDGKEIIRITLSKEHIWDTGENGHLRYTFDIVHLVVGRCTKKILPNSADTWSTIWSSDLEILSQEDFYKIGDHSNWYGTKEEAMAQQDKKHERWKTTMYDCDTKFFENAAEVVLPFVQRQPKSKSVKLHEITSVTKEFCIDGHPVYRVHARGRAFSMH